MSDIIEIASDRLSASVNRHGAQLWTLRDAAGRDLLFNGDATYWAWRAPILFPVIGRSPNDTVRYDGRPVAMPSHGFGRDHPFAVTAREPHQIVLTQSDNPETRALYPFAYRLTLRFAITGATLDTQVEIANPGPAPMPASFGFHPAFLWPLDAGTARTDHCVLFEADEPEPIRRLDHLGTGLLVPGTRPSPVKDRRLALDDSLFDRGALVFDRHRSRSVWFGVPGHAGLKVDFPDMPQLGIWTRPGNPFLCIEPWQGLADRADADGELKHRPGIVMIAPGETLRRSMQVTLADAPTR